MNNSHHRTERLNIVNAARALNMSVPALGERIQAGDLTSEFHGGYTFIPVAEVHRFADALREEAKAAQEAESERARQEDREKDGAFIAREMTHLEGLARKYGYSRIDEG